MTAPPAPRGFVASDYTAYTRGERTPEARKAMRDYMAARRAAGEISMNDVRVPEVLDKAGNSVMQVSTVQRAIIVSLVNLRTTPAIAANVNLSERTVRRNLKALRLAAGVITNDQLADEFVQKRMFCQVVG